MLEVIGWFGAFCLMVCGLPQLFYTYKVKTVKGLSFWMLVSWLLGLSASAVYVILSPNILWPLFFNYAFNTLVVIVLLILYFKYR